MFDDGITPPAVDWSAHLLDAVARGDLTEVRHALHSGAEVNALFKGDFTPLHVAVHIGSPEIVELLCDSGASVNAQTCIGDCPITFAVATNGPIAIVEILRKYGANLSVANSLQATPLHFAFHFENWPMIALLLWGGANAALRDSMGRLPRDLAPGVIPEDIDLLYKVALKRKMGR